MEKFSQEFEESYLEALSRLHGTKRVPANQVYQELICNKTHIHMNATKWDSLTTFVKYLGKKGICLVDETEKGWFVQWIDREYMLRREELEKARKEEVEEEVRQQRLMAARAAAAAAAAAGKGEEKGAEASRELKRGDGESKIVIGVHGDSGGGGIKRARVNVFEREEEDDGLGMIKKKAVGEQGGLEKGGGKKSEMEKLMEQDAARKAAEERARKKEEGGKEGERTEQWLARGIVVKIINKRLGGGRFYKKKGRVEKLLEGGFVAELCLLGDGEGGRVRIDQEELETVIPAPGGQVIVLNGRGRGKEGVLMGLDEERYACRVRLREGKREVVLEGVEYEDVCKFDRDWLLGEGR